MKGKVVRVDEIKRCVPFSEVSPGYTALLHFRFFDYYNDINQLSASLHFSLLLYEAKKKTGSGRTEHDKELSKQGTNYATAGMISV